MRRWLNVMSAESRTFTSPSGRTWTASAFSGIPGAAPVLRFRSGDVVLDLADFPADWIRLSDAALVALARRGEPPRFAPPTPLPTVAPAAPARAAGEAATANEPRAELAVPEGEDSFANRMALAFLSLQVRSGGTAGGRMERVSPGAFAGLVTERLRTNGAGREVSANEVVSWFADTLPDLPTVRAIAEACGVDPGWLGFGVASRAPSPTATLGVPTSTRAARWTQPGAPGAHQPSADNAVPPGHG